MDKPGKHHLNQVIEITAPRMTLIRRTMNTEYYFSSSLVENA